MADEARAMLDALMGADRNAPVQGASGIHQGQNSSSHGGPRRQKRSCYDPDICPLYCAWSLSSATSPTWAESVAANENAGGIDVYDLFTNTKSDIGPNPYKVDDHAREEFASLPDHEKRRLGFEEMLARKLGDLVRQCDRTVARNKEKLRQEVARAMKQRTAGSGRGNREDLIVTVDPEMLENCAKNVAQAQLIEEEMAELVEEVEKLEEEEKILVKEIEEKEAKEREEAEAKKKESKTKEKSKKKEKKKDKDKSSSKSDDDPNALQSNPIDPRLISVQKLKLSKLLHLQSLSLQLPPLRDNIDNLLRQLQYLRSDTSTDKIVCEVSGNFMSSRDADERIAAHYAGKQYVGWKLVREKLKELQKRGFGTGSGGGGDRGVRDMGREREMRGPPPAFGDRYGGPPRGGGGYGGPPPPHHAGWGGNGGYGSGGGYSGSHRGRDRGVGGGVGGGSDNHRRRSRSRDRDQRRDDRWERDRYRGRR